MFVIIPMKRLFVLSLYPILFVFGSTVIDDGSACILLNHLVLIAVIIEYYFAGEQNQGAATEL